ncbi:cytochrome c551 [Terribacillus halophilus]|uniref:Cytochrome c551 n=1 Tax=Terribacillus halophilus TaxID=361279 RepID=A0A1G6J0R4_9BACI|nr:cytochrome c [Terribacillus halophilus]SDC12328.1 cytochrome c551 [Terribacillus halophilus]
MKKIAIACSSLGFMLFLAACGSNDDAAETPQEAYENNCAMCHGQDLSGGNGGPPLDNLGSKYTQEELVDIMENGKGGMPAGQAEGEEAEKIAEWLQDQQE